MHVRPLRLPGGGPDLVRFPELAREGRGLTGSASWRTAALPAFLAGLAAAVLHEVFRDLGDLTGHPDGVQWAVWIVLAVLGALGAGRVASVWARAADARPPSVLACLVPCALGGLSVSLLPGGWLRLLGGTGMLLMLFLALAVLAGLMDVALRIRDR